MRQRSRSTMCVWNRLSMHAPRQTQWRWSARPSRGDHIAMLAVDGGGVRVAYRKVWVDATEAHRFSQGGEPGLLELDDWRLGLAICKDTGIGEHAADTAALGIDAYVGGILMFA